MRMNPQYIFHVTFISKLEIIFYSARTAIILNLVNVPNEKVEVYPIYVILASLMTTNKNMSHETIVA